MNSFRNNRLRDLERACPEVGREWIRTLLAELKKSGDVACHFASQLVKFHLNAA